MKFLELGMGLSVPDMVRGGNKGLRPQIKIIGIKMQEKHMTSKWSYVHHYNVLAQFMDQWFLKINNGRKEPMI